MTVAPPEHEPIAQITMWREELTALHDRIAPRFARPEVRARAGRFLAGLLDPTERRNGWQLAEAVGERSPDGVQHQYAGTVGRIENCQIGIFLAYASPCGRAFLARALYLPKAWAEDRLRRRAAGVPDESVFATKGELAQGAGTRWVIAEGFQCAKGEVGLVTTRCGAGRDGTGMSRCACSACLSRGDAGGGQKGGGDGSLIPLTAPEVRRLLAVLLLSWEQRQH